MRSPETARKRAPQPVENAHSAVAIDAGSARAFVLAIAIVALFAYFLRSILLPFIVTGIIAYVCTPLLDWLTKHVRLPRALVAVLMALLLIGAIGFTVTFAGQQLVAEVKSTAADLQGTLEHLLRQATSGKPIQLFGQSLDADEITRNLLGGIRDWISQPTQLALLTGAGLAAIMGVFLTIVLLIYFLMSGPSVARGLFWMIPPTRRVLAERIWARLDPVLKRYFLGVLVIVLYSMAAAYVGLGLVLGIDHAGLLAVMTGVLEVLPVVGSTAAAIIAGLVSLHTASGLTSIIAFASYAVVLRLTIDQIVAPLVLGRAAHVHPVLIIFCFLAGASLLGIAGVIIAVPVALAVKNTLATVYGENDR
jgi:predicted PurR-regulated permease PerM